MSHVKAIALSQTAESVLAVPIAALVFTVRAMLGSLLGIATAALFGVSALVLFAGVRPDIAITVVALSLNAMLFCLMLLGSISENASS
jgi:hypothetical protein